MTDTRLTAEERATLEDGLDCDERRHQKLLAKIEKNVMRIKAAAEREAVAAAWRKWKAEGWLCHTQLCTGNTPVLECGCGFVEEDRRQQEVRGG